ncbi:MAG: glutamyl-tRNA amidotransferase [Flavobacteriaceae bacterium]|jgi:uncharacterized protein YqeY|nr:glutamyl-tRNA amidotransferase [Flavobacteriaceae bacterium]|tara:strand:- start:32072 stop:32521 length:450 start_codon:yes stop_codon:yes gene_type:complete
MPSDLKSSIKKEVIVSMKSGDKFRTTTLRLIVSSIQSEEINLKSDLSDDQCIQILEKMIKQRKDSISQFEAAKRSELADKEKEEIKTIQEFMPEQMSESEISKIVAKVILDLQADSMKDMGKVMSKLKEITAGKADAGLISQAVKKSLS